MRYMFFVVVLMVASAAQAAFIESMGVAYSAANADPQSQVIEGTVLISTPGAFMGAPSSLYTWTIPGLSDDNLGDVITLDASTAAGYGIDWAVIESRWNDFTNYDFNIHTFYSVDGGNVSDVDNRVFFANPLSRRPGTAIVAVDYVLLHNFPNRQGGGPLLVGEARLRFLAPEPTCAVLCGCALIALTAIRRRVNTE